MDKNLRLERVQIKNLFNRFSYDIDFNNGYDVSILIAPNGCGKTTIFNIVSFIFHPTTTGFSRIASIPFDECACTLSNGKTVKITRKETKEANNKRVWASAINSALLSGMYSSDVFARLGITAALTEDRKYEVITDFVITVGKKSISINKILEKTQKKLDSGLSFVALGDDEDYEELQQRYQEMVKRTDFVKNDVSSFLRENNCELGVEYISSDRLLYKVKPSNNADKSRIDYRLSSSVIDQVRIAQEDTKYHIKNIIDEYNKLQSEAKDKLPKKYLLVDDRNASMSEEEFIDRWKKYTKNIEKYKEIGFIDSTENVLSNRELKGAYKSKGAFLCAYLETFEETLLPLEKEYVKFKMFIDILNDRNRITKKVLKYGKEGIVLTVDDEVLPLSCMSSGEKNDFVMFYSLVFNSQNANLVLIDEPEISLHIEWQETYIDTLLKICEMNGLQSIVATHSPNIINGHFELYAKRGLIDGAEHKQDK